MRRNPGFPGDVLHQRPPGIRRIGQLNIFRDRQVRLCVPRQVAIGEQAYVGIQGRI